MPPASVQTVWFVQKTAWPLQSATPANLPRITTGGYRLKPLQAGVYLSLGVSWGGHNETSFNTTT